MHQKGNAAHSTSNAFYCIRAEHKYGATKTTVEKFRYLSMDVNKKSFSLGESWIDGLDFVVIVVVGGLGIGASLSCLKNFTIDVQSSPREKHQYFWGVEWHSLYK